VVFEPVNLWNPVRLTDTKPLPASEVFAITKPGSNRESNNSRLPFESPSILMALFLSGFTALEFEAFALVAMTRIEPLCSEKRTA
jgi:hypothetical protein